MPKSCNVLNLSIFTIVETYLLSHRKQLLRVE